MSEATKSDVLMRIVPELEAQGYEVFVRPHPTVLPTFIKGFVPDLIALGADKNLAIEISRRSSGELARMEQFIALFKDQPRWDHRIVWIEPTSAGESFSVETAETIRRRLDDVRELADAGRLEAALLLSWAIFEAAGRRLAQHALDKAQTSSHLIATLAEVGYLTPSEAELSRAVAEKRNKLSHGELQTRIDEGLLKSFIPIIATLADISPN